MAIRGPIPYILGAKARFNPIASNPNEPLAIRLDEIQRFLADFIYQFKNDARIYRLENGKKAQLIHYKNNDKFSALRQELIQKLNKLSVEYKNANVDWHNPYNQPHLSLEGKLLQSLSKLFIPLQNKISMGSNIKNGHLINGLIEKFKNYVAYNCRSKQNFLLSLTHITQTLSCLHDFNLDYLTDAVHAKCNNTNDPTYLINQAYLGHGIKAYAEIDAILKEVFMATSLYLNELDAISLLHLMHAAILLSEHKNFQPVSEEMAQIIFARIETDMLNSQQGIISNDIISKFYTFKNAYPKIFPVELNAVLANRLSAMETHDSTFENEVLKKIQTAYASLEEIFPGLMNLNYFSKNPLDADSGRESDLMYQDPANDLYLSFQVDGDKYHTYDGESTTIKTKFRDFCLGNKYKVINIRDDQNSIDQMKVILLEHIIRPTLNKKVPALMEGLNNKNSAAMLQNLVEAIRSYKNTISEPGQVNPFDDLENKVNQCLANIEVLSNQVPMVCHVSSLSDDIAHAREDKAANTNQMENLEKEIRALKEPMSIVEHSIQKVLEELDLTNKQNAAILKQREDTENKLKKYRGKPEVVYNANKKEIDDFVTKHSKKGSAPNRPKAKVNFVISTLEKFCVPAISTASLAKNVEKLRSDKAAMEEKMQLLQQDLKSRQDLDTQLDEKIVDLRLLERSLVDFNKLQVEANQYPSNFESLKQAHSDYLSTQKAFTNQLNLQNSRYAKNSGGYQNNARGAGYSARGRGRGGYRQKR